MRTDAIQLIPKYNTGHWNKILLFPLSRMIMLILLITISIFAVDLLADALAAGLTGTSRTVANYIAQIALTLILYAVYRGYVRIVEKRRVHELSGIRAAGETLTGIMIGASLIGTTVLVMAVAGYYRITGFNQARVLVTGFFTFGYGAFFEELLFRLIIFKLAEEWLGSWIALAISAALFGGAHLFNDNATWWSAVAITVEAGILLAAAFMLTRRIWLALGLHFGWNFMQATLLGIPTSGIRFGGLVNTQISGPAWLTGGEFGVEASVFTVIIGLMVAIYLLRNAIADDQILPPLWHRKAKPRVIY